MNAPLKLVVVTHNSAGWLTALADSWHQTQSHVGRQMPAVIADAGSTDNSGDAASAALGNAQVLRLENHGFGATANAGIRACDTPWVLLCNADVTFAGDFLERALGQLARADDQTAGIAPRLRNPDGTVQPSVGRFPTIGSTLADQLRPRPWRKYVRPQPVAEGAIDWASGACLLLRREAVMSVGGFDERYFLYVEEVDLQRRLKESGKGMCFAPDLVVTHHQPNAVCPPRPEVQRYAARGMLRYFAKFGGLTRYRALGLLSLRLGWGEALASREKILHTPTGP